MKILVLMKRFSSNKDQIMQNFGREVRLFSELSKLGQTVTILCADQTRGERKSLSLNGMKVEIRPFALAGMLSYAKEARRMARENDVIIGTSHPLLGYLAYRARGKKKMAYDLRDNYETYNFTNLPLLKKGPIPKMINNRITRKCDLAICVSESLKQKIAEKRIGPAVVVQNGVSTKLFRKLNKQKCRKKLGLTQKAAIIVYTGHISKERGVDKLIEAFNIIRQKKPETVLLLSGKIDGNVNIKQPGIIYNELPRRKDVVTAINASDVAVLPQPENETTKYTFPYKLMEYMACNIPVVATAVGDVKHLLQKEKLAQPGNIQDMAEKITTAMSTRPNYTKIVEEYTWEKLARKLNTELVKLR